jgi:hypothetical protein
MTNVLKHPCHPDEVQDRQDALEAFLTTSQLTVALWLSDWELENHKVAYRIAQVTDANQDTAAATFWFEKKDDQWQFLTWEATQNETE